MKIEFLQKSKVYNIILYIILFFYIYSVEFNCVPLGLGTRVFIGILGFIYFIIEILIKNINFKFQKDYLYIFLTLLLIISISAISAILNKTCDIEFIIKYPISIIIILFASYFIKNLIVLKYKKIEIHNIIKLIINIVIIQIIISLLMFSIPALREFLNSIQIYNEHEIKVLQETQNFRLNGFGSRFFGAGIINGFALILITSLIKFQKKETKVLKLSFAYLFIFVFGMMMARTTIIGAFLSFVILLIPQNLISITQIKKHLKFSYYITSIPIFISVIIIIIFPGIQQYITNIFKFGFEMFINYFSSNSFESESTNKMLEMYIWPSSLKTYIIGDGLFTDLITKKYYMNTDIGYLRLIYYFGVIGMMSYFTFQLVLINSIYKLNRGYKYTFIIIFIYLTILNFKGFTDCFYICILFLISNSSFKKID